MCQLPHLCCAESTMLYLYISLGPWQRFKVCSALPCRRGAARGQQHKQNSIGGPYHPPLWRCHSTEAQQACWAVEGWTLAWLVGRLVHTANNSSTLSSPNLEKLRPYLSPSMSMGLPCGLVGGPYHPPLWHCHSRRGKDRHGKQKLTHT